MLGSKNINTSFADDVAKSKEEELKKVLIIRESVCVRRGGRRNNTALAITYSITTGIAADGVECCFGVITFLSFLPIAIILH
jgi:hypothetical protein